MFAIILSALVQVVCLVMGMIAGAAASNDERGQLAISLVLFVVLEVVAGYLLVTGCGA